MKDLSSIKTANINTHPSPMGTRQPLPRPPHTGSQFFPPNILQDKGDGADDNTSTPTTPSPKPHTTVSQLPPSESEENATTLTLNSLIFTKDTTVEMPLDTLHSSPAQTPAPTDDDEMTDLIISSPLPTKPAVSTQDSEEDLLRAHLAVTETNQSIIKSNSTNSLTVIPQFTPIPIGGFPHIHLTHAAQLFNYQAAKVITAWLKVPHPKILVRVFDHDRKNPSVKGPILDVKVLLPYPDASKEDADFPLSFLVYNISDETKSLILNQHIWSSPEISFAAHLFRVNSPPLLLFCLHSFSTMDTATVKTTVHEVWSEDVTRWDICNIMSESDIPEECIHAATWDFINSLWVEHLDFKVSGGILLLCYNVFTVSPTNNPTVWTKLRAYLHSLTYPSELEGSGTAVNFMPCTLRHSIAHPHRLCPFPNVPLWNGPKHSTNSRPNLMNQKGKGKGRRYPGNGLPN
ncbi:uncharacterized protein BJ212DRAFT_1479281 [Suillus subaureus]|uniref:Uncharacterized protein n=1 Tax=Suillus subaureus TaxID=48587 RepID=A0A9P7EEM5_9AGAM|nr:uncharacterized protein BJ212DRAFT_1479281 [Suillus subaureus]KAG1819172.1 hypothetical protein BJ212DRAFT_1479281 [Suillus subaureus]